MKQAVRIFVVAAVAGAAFAGAYFLFRSGPGSPDVPGAAGTPAGQDDAMHGADDHDGSAAPAAACPEQAGTRPGYSLQIEPRPNPPRAEGTNFVIAVTHDGRPVTGAQVCMTADMVGMAHEGAAVNAEEVSAGRYEISGMTFVMRGPWSGSVVVQERGKEPVALPVSFEVQ